MLKGIIVKGIGGFYYVKTEVGIITCRARGKFRKDAIIPMVGDEVEITLSKEDITTGSVEKIYSRKKQMVRPPVANINQAVIVLAAAYPDPNMVLVDQFIVAAELEKLTVMLCINKIDLDVDRKHIALCNTYKNAGYQVVCTSTKTQQGIKDLYDALQKNISVFAGASGVGKSSLLNEIKPNFNLETGAVSEKIKRGKHTTRHVELLALEKDSYVLDTPGFSSIDLKNVRKEELSFLFKEFVPHVDYCKFKGCSHISEPKCAVVDALKAGKICQARYDNYKQFYNQLKDIKEWQR